MYKADDTLNNVQISVINTLYLKFKGDLCKKIKKLSIGANVASFGNVKITGKSQMTCQISLFIFRTVCRHISNWCRTLDSVICTTLFSKQSNVFFIKSIKLMIVSKYFKLKKVLRLISK